MRRYAARIGLLLLGGLAALVISEAVLRHTRYAALLPSADGMPLHYYRADRENGFDIAASVPPTMHRLRERPYPVWSNELGCFDRPFVDHRGPYTLLMGDSFTWGVAPFEDKWGTLLERHLGERVLKCGVSGYGTRQALIKARRLLARLPPPRAIVLGYFVNDADDDATVPNYLVHRGGLVFVGKLGAALGYDGAESALPDLVRRAERYCMWAEPEHPTFQRVKCVLRRHSIVYVLAQERVKLALSTGLLRTVRLVNRPMPEPPVADRSTRVGHHFENLAAFQALAGSVGARLVVVLVTPPREWVSDAAGDPYVAVKAFLDARGIPFVDLWPAFRTRRTPLYWPVDLHWNVAGNHLAGLLVSRELIERDLLPVPDKAAALARIRAALAEEFGP